MLNRRGSGRVQAGPRTQPESPCPLSSAPTCLAQGFIRHRSRTRWLAHQLVFWGCILAGLVTIPLTLGLLHFESVGQQADRYQVYISGVGTVKFDAESISGWLMFHALTSPRMLVLAGVFIFLRRRLRDPGALATERSGDFLALAGLFAVSVTGLFLTVSSLFLDGQFYATLNTLHAVTVILAAHVHPVRQALPHLPAPRQPRRRVRQIGERPRARRGVQSLRRALRERDRWPISKPSSPKSGSTTRSTAGAATSRRARGAAGEHRSRRRQSARVGGFG